MRVFILNSLKHVLGPSYIRLRSCLRPIWLHRPIDIVRIHKRPKWQGEDDRFSYQRLYNDFDIKAGEAVLDVSCGSYPFPKATILADAYLGNTPHRYGPLVHNDQPFVQCAIENLPFHDRSIDFLYCSHTLEHVQDPLQACREIMRVARRGYIETPTIGTDALFCWAKKSQHKWQGVGIRKILTFFEYSDRQLEGVRSSAWNDKIFSPYYHPLQEAFYTNQDIFNTMFMWNKSFFVFVFKLDGTVDTNYEH